MVATTFGLLATASPVAADDVDFAELTRRARTDADRLVEVDAVNGRPVDMTELLSSDRAAKVRTLAELPAVESAVDTGDARSRAADILSRPEYADLDAELDPPLWARAIQWILDRLPEGTGTAFGIIGLLVLLAVTALALTSGRRQVRRGRELREVEPDTPDGTSPAELERAAVDAARRGDYSTAVRLRFAAAVLRLGERGALDTATAATSGAVRRALPSDDVDRLATTFDRVAYGNAEADAADATDAEQTWPRILAGMR